MSLEPTARISSTAAFAVAVDACEPVAEKRAWYLRGRVMFAMWAGLSILWGLGVAYNVCQRVSIQADMSRDVEADLDQGFVTASCTGPRCAGDSALAARTQNWSGIASTFIKFGSDEMAECVFGPPVALLVIGLGTAFILRRRPYGAK